jgi:hypothetical protein
MKLEIWIQNLEGKKNLEQLASHPPDFSQKVKKSALKKSGFATSGSGTIFFAKKKVKNMRKSNYGSHPSV